MLPKAPQTAQGDLFKSELIAIIDSNHPLVRLADKIDWQQFEKSLHPTYVPGKGAPAINTRLMVALHILKFQHNLSDQAVVDRWVENPYWQFFSGMRFFSHQPPVDPSSMTRWRTRLGESGSEEILKASLQTALKVGAARESDFKDINVDTTVQTKDIRHPTDSRLYHRVLERLVKTARKEGFVIKQSYVRVGKRLLMMQGRYAHARQMNRAKGVQRKLRTILGRVIREVELVGICFFLRFCSSRARYHAGRAKGRIAFESSEHGGHLLTTERFPGRKLGASPRRSVFSLKPIECPPWRMRVTVLALCLIWARCYAPFVRPENKQGSAQEISR